MKKANNFEWDRFSDQPKVLTKEFKHNLRRGSLWSQLKMILSFFLLSPLLFVLSIFIKQKIKKRPKDFYGLCVNMDKGDTQYKLVDDLGVVSIQIRVFLRDIQNIDDYVKFANGFKNKKILINIIQDSTHIKDSEKLKQSITIVFKKFQNITNEFMIGNAINRIKWEFVTPDEYLRFYKTIYDIKEKNFSSIYLVGSSVIDFEYHWTIRTLYNGFKIRYDIVSALLYVDRRGAPQNKQMFIFNLSNKIKFLCSIAKFSRKTKNNIYITETNWPLSGTSPWAPTSEKECVNIDNYTKYMVDYFDISSRYLMIKKVFWHQLIAAGYGLVDDRDGKLIKTKAYDKFKDMVSGGHD